VAGSCSECPPRPPQWGGEPLLRKLHHLLVARSCSHCLLRKASPRAEPGRCCCQVGAIVRKVGSWCLRLPDWQLPQFRVCESAIVRAWVNSAKGSPGRMLPLVSTHTENEARPNLRLQLGNALPGATSFAHVEPGALALAVAWRRAHSQDALQTSLSGGPAATHAAEWYQAQIINFNWSLQAGSVRGCDLQHEAHGRVPRQGQQTLAGSACC
jgi:hypothetical protein